MRSKLSPAPAQCLLQPPVEGKLLRPVYKGGFVSEAASDGAARALCIAAARGQSREAARSRGKGGQPARGRGRRNRRGANRERRRRRRCHAVRGARGKEDGAGLAEAAAPRPHAVSEGAALNTSCRIRGYAHLIAAQAARPSRRAKRGRAATKRGAQRGAPLTRCQRGCPLPCCSGRAPPSPP